MTEILETAGRYRLRLSVDTEPMNPRLDYDHITHVITPKGQRYIDVDKNGGPLQEAWDYFAERADGGDLFIRWARIYHGATVIEDSPHDGARSFWYLMPGDAEGIPDPKAFIENDLQEYRSWAEGDVYGYVIEKSVMWQRTETAESETMITWEETDSCWGLVGREYAEGEARQSFEPYRTEAQA